MCVECTKSVIEILDLMENEGKFDGLTDDDKEVQRHTEGMIIRSTFTCPNEVNLEQIIKDKISEIRKYYNRHIDTLSEQEKERYGLVITNFENIILIKRQRELTKKIEQEMT